MWLKVIGLGVTALPLVGRFSLSSTATVLAGTRYRRAGWLFRADRARFWFRPRQHGDTGAKAWGRLVHAVRVENVDHELSYRGRVHRLGERRRRDGQGFHIGEGEFRGA